MSTNRQRIADSGSGWREMSSPPSKENADVISPLLPIVRFVRCLSYVGCPLTILDARGENNEAIEFTVVKRPLLKFAAACFIPYILFGVVMLVFYFFNLPLSHFLEELQTYGFATIDVVAMIMLAVPLVLASVMQYVAVKSSCENLSIFSMELSSLKGLKISPDEAQQHFKVISRHLYVMSAAAVFSAFLYTYMVLEVQIGDWSLNSFLPCFFIYGLIVALCYVPQILLLSYLLQQHCLGMVELALKKCANKFGDKFNVVLVAKRVEEEEAIPEFVDASIHLARIVDVVGEALGLVMRIEITFDAVSGTFGFYFGTIIVTAFTGGEFNKMLFIGGLNFLIIGLIMTGRMVSLLGKGQGISDQVSRIKTLMRNILLHQDPTAQDSKKIIYLLDKWSEGGAPIRPCDLFDLNKSTGMAIAGVLLTYVVVLLQFKRGV